MFASAVTGSDPPVGNQQQTYTPDRDTNGKIDQHTRLGSFCQIIVGLEETKGAEPAYILRLDRCQRKWHSRVACLQFRTQHRRRFSAIHRKYQRHYRRQSLREKLLHPHVTPFLALHFFLFVIAFSFVPMLVHYLRWYFDGTFAIVNL